MGVVNNDYLYLSGLFLLMTEDDDLFICPNRLTAWLKEGKRYSLFVLKKALK